MEQHSELSHEGDENEVMLQTGPQVLAQLRQPPVFNAFELFAKLTLGVPAYAVGQGKMRINPHFTSFHKFCI